jgi:hypothetical protein
MEPVSVTEKAYAGVLSLVGVETGVTSAIVGAVVSTLKLIVDPVALTFPAPSVSFATIP